VADWLFSGDKNAGVLPLLIPTGMRALSVPVDEVSDIAGFVLPHARVDVLVSATSDGRPLSKIVLQNVEVLAIAQDIEQVNDKPEVVHVVTMLVTPDQAERLTLAGGQGGLRLALRNYEDQSVVATDGVTVAQLLNEQPETPTITAQQHVVFAPPRARPKPVSIEVLRNGATSESVYFIRAGSDPSGSMQMAPSEPVAPPAAPPSSANDSGMANAPDNFSSAGPAMLFKAPSAVSSPPRRTSAAGSATRGIDDSASAPFDARAPQSSYDGPTSRTIDVP